jgi:hypothetical protein
VPGGFPVAASVFARVQGPCGADGSPATRRDGQKHGTIQRVVSQLSCGVESLRLWVKHADIDAGEAPGTTTADAERIRRL